MTNGLPMFSLKNNVLNPFKNNESNCVLGKFILAYITMYF